jgi:hypothetical protein
VSRRQEERSALVHSAKTISGNAHHVDRTSKYVIHELAGRGVLAHRAASVSSAEITRLREEAYDIAWPIVFERLTTRIEYRRGHARCARSVRHLEPECFDRFQDDVEAVLDDLFRNAKVPIHNLEGWIAKRINAATVDRHRRRRGERGALQRPRLPRWLGRALAEDPWLTQLALEILTWVGVPITAGTGVWPLNTWAEHRRVATGDERSDDGAVVRDVETVLAAMRRRPVWYEDFVERPLGHKHAPVLSMEAGAAGDWPHLPLVPQHELEEAHLRELACLAATAIQERLRTANDPRAAVEEVLHTVFAGGTDVEHLDAISTPGPDRFDWLMTLFADRAAMDQVVSAILAIFTD